MVCGNIWDIVNVGSSPAFPKKILVFIMLEVKNGDKRISR